MHESLLVDDEAENLPEEDRKAVDEFIRTELRKTNSLRTASTSSLNTSSGIQRLDSFKRLKPEMKSELRTSAAQTNSSFNFNFNSYTTRRVEIDLTEPERVDLSNFGQKQQFLPKIPPVKTEPDSRPI